MSYRHHRARADWVAARVTQISLNASSNPSAAASMEHDMRLAVLESIATGQVSIEECIRMAKSAASTKVLSFKRTP